ncbi:MAG TPA: gamma-glutamyltransferase [Jiangellaceae bacterium]
MKLNRRRRFAALPVLATALALGLVQPAASQALPRDVDKQPTATGFGGAVASLDRYGANAGLEILRRGGNAVDAAVAAAATLGVTRPYDGSIGGGGFMVIYSADTGEVTTIDSREQAPASMQPDVFLENGQVIPFQERRVSGLSIGVPGTLRGWERALSEYGTMPMHRVLQPAITIAQRGFVVDEEYQRRTEDNLAVLRDFTSSSETFLIDGEAPQAGTIFRNRQLADTYKMIAKTGTSVFYEGEIAEAIADTVNDPPVVPDTDRNVRPGDMSVADLAGYEAIEREPTMINYRGFEVYGMGPPSSGGSTVGEALNILEGFDVGGVATEQALHLLIESSALAFADRNAYLGDSDFVDVPLTGLLSDGFADVRRELIGDLAGDKPFAPGDPWPFNGGSGALAGVAGGAADGSTTHLTVADRFGNVVSYTFTIEQIAGSGIAVPGYGFLLNNELTDFDTNPAHPANAPAGGKRPRSSMSPTIVLDANGQPFAAFGSPGGARIISTVLQIAVNMIDFGMTLPEAIAAPRISNLGGPTTGAELAFLATPDAAALEARGHQFSSLATIGNATGVAFLPDGRLQAVAEPERLGGGSAVVLRPAG